MRWMNARRRRAGRRVWDAILAQARLRRSQRLELVIARDRRGRWRLFGRVEGDLALMSVGRGYETRDEAMSVAARVAGATPAIVEAEPEPDEPEPDDA